MLQSKGLSRVLRYYHVSVRIRNFVFNPIARFFSFFGITSNMLSFFGVIMLIFFIFFIKKNILISLIFLLIGIIVDAVDGVLARYQKKSSDRGKFIDMVCDNLNFTLFVIGLVYAGLLNGLIGLICVYSMVLSKLFRIIVNSRFLESDWHFKAVAGFLPNLCAVTSYLSLPIIVFFRQNYFDLLLIVFSFILIIDSFIFYCKIIKK